MIISNCGGDAMIVKIDEIGKMMAKRMKEMSLNAKIVSERTGIAQSTLSEFFRGISFKKCFNTLEKVADVLNIPSITIIFKSHLSDEEYKKLYGQPDNIDLNTLLPEYRKQVLKLVEKSNRQKREMLIKEQTMKKRFTPVNLPFMIYLLRRRRLLLLIINCLTISKTTIQINRVITQGTTIFLIFLNIITDSLSATLFTVESV